VYLSELWRYPVKSMGGERLDGSELTAAGIPGDRVLRVERHGRTVTSRSRPGLLLHHARLGEGSEPLIDERAWTDPSVARDVAEAAGDDARLVRTVGLERFDVLPLLVATDGAIARLGYDGRRFRPNLVIGGVDGYAERGWEGRRLAIGEAVIFAVDLRERCIMTTFDPDSAEQNVEVLKRIHRELDGTFALNCRVERAARVHLGDPVRLLD
jgi:uncharacterized protein YcbX